MSRQKHWRRAAAVTACTVFGTALFPFASLAVQNTESQDSWERNFSAIESVVNGISSSEQVPDKTNQTRYAQDTVKAYPQSSGTSNSTGTSSSNKTSSSGGFSTRASATSSGSASSKRNSEESGGPGSSNISNKIDDSDQTTGPVVTDVSLSETYYEDYAIYCLSIQDLYYFYSTIGNNGITDQPVSVDIPANITYSLTKDGMPMDYVSKQQLTETGTYVFRITIVQNPEDSVSRQNIIRTNYHFRIQPKAPKPKEEQTTQAQSDSSYLPDNYLGNLQTGGQISRQDSYGYTGNTEDSSLTVQSSGEETETSETVSSQENAASSEDGLSQEKMPEDEADAVPAVSGKTDLQYDYEHGLYVTSFADGSSLQATVPNGMMTNYDVTLQTQELPETFRLLKDGEEYTVPEDGILRDPGSYEVLVPFQDQVFTYSFRILGDAEGNLDYYTVPQSVTLKEFYIDGVLQGTDRYTDANGVQRVHFAEDGVYRLVMQDELGAVFDCELILDRKPPVVSVEVTKGMAQIQYGDPSEIEKVILRSGRKEETLSAITQVTGSGLYEMEVYDHAGNHTTVNFRVRGSVNMATVVSIVMLVGIIAAFVVLFIRTKRDGKVS